MVTSRPSSLKYPRSWANVQIDCGACHTQSRRKRTGVNCALAAVVNAQTISNPKAALRNRVEALAMSASRNRWSKDQSRGSRSKCYAKAFGRASVEMGKTLERGLPLQRIEDERLEHRSLRARLCKEGLIGRAICGRKLLGFGEQLLLVDLAASTIAVHDLAADQDRVDVLARFIHHEMVPDVPQGAMGRLAQVDDGEVRMGADADHAELARLAQHGRTVRGRHAQRTRRRDPPVTVCLTDATEQH